MEDNEEPRPDAGLENDEEPRVKGTEPQAPTLSQQGQENNLARLGS